MTASAYSASAEVIFGSAARGDNDQQSDRDILIVDDDVVILKQRSHQLSKAGWSVAAYTFDKLSALVRSRSLFLQHLKLEGQISVDKNCRLATLLDHYSPKESYTFEIEQNSEIARISGHIPPGSRAALLAADILYVTVRNYGILSLAELGVHKYAYSEVLEALEVNRLIARGGGRALAQLRFLKCLYRSGETLVGSRIVDTVQNALDVLPRDRFPSKIKVISAERILKASGPDSGSPAYLQLRDLERRLISLQSLGYTGDLNDNLCKLRRWIQNPRAYAAISSRVAPAMREMLRQQLVSLELSAVCGQRFACGKS